MNQASNHAVDFYSQHPISLAIVLTRLLSARGGLEGVQPSELWAHDQDHFGGLSWRQIGVHRLGLL
jgi:sarcosine/dimethylglycine N-methyltransferase